MGDASWWELITFNWLRPYIQRAKKGKISVEQCGNLRDQDRIEPDIAKFNILYA